MTGLIDQRLIDDVRTELAKLSHMEDRRPWAKVRQCLRTAMDTALDANSGADSMAALAREHGGDGYTSLSSPGRRPVTSPTHGRGHRLSAAEARELRRKTLLVLDGKGSTRNLDAKALRHLELKAKSQQVRPMVSKRKKLAKFHSDPVASCPVPGAAPGTPGTPRTPGPVGASAWAFSLLLSAPLRDHDPKSRRIFDQRKCADGVLFLGLQSSGDPELPCSKRSVTSPAPYSSLVDAPEVIRKSCHYRAAPPSPSDEYPPAMTPPGKLNSKLPAAA